MLYYAMAYSAEDLEMVQHHIAQGERHVLRQEELISRLRARGLPTREAEDLLRSFQRTLRQHHAHGAIIARTIGRES